MIPASDTRHEPAHALLTEVSGRMRLFLSVVENCVLQLDDSQV